MKHMTSQSTYSIALAVAMAVFSATIAFASARPSRVEHVEARIKELQAKLHITPTQEALWQNVTQIMRDNAQTMDALTQARTDKVKTMTAVDNLQSYSAIVEAHAEGLKKFVPAFEALYPACRTHKSTRRITSSASTGTGGPTANDGTLRTI